MSTLSADTVRRIEDAAAALTAAGHPNPTNEQVRAHPGGGSPSHISPAMRELRPRPRALAPPPAAAGAPAPRHDPLGGPGPARPTSPPGARRAVPAVGLVVRAR